MDLKTDAEKSDGSKKQQTLIKILAQRLFNIVYQVAEIILTIFFYLVKKVTKLLKEQCCWQ